MFQHYFEVIEGVEIYPIFSLIVFIIFFTGNIDLVFKAERNI